MSHKSKHLWFLIFVVSFALQSGPLSAQLFRKHWYHDPVYPSISNSSAARASTFSRHGYGHANRRSSTNTAVATVGGVAASHTTHSPHPSEPSNAILKLWVTDGLKVTVNGKATKPQSLAGNHRNSRLFSLLGLRHDTFSNCEIVIEDPHGTEFHHSLSVVAGGNYDVRYPRDFKPVPPGSGKATGRVTKGLQVLYLFDEQHGQVVHDRSGCKPPINLSIDLGSSTAWVHPRGLHVRQDALVRSDKPATRLTKAIAESGEITIEAWVHTGLTSQTGPARIVTLSKDPNERNLTLGHDGDKLQVRMRTEGGDKNGLGGQELVTPPGAVKDQLLHVVYTRNKQCIASIYVNGKLQRSETHSGPIGDWEDYRLALANELRDNRAWLGTYYLVAIYDRALSPVEAAQNCNRKY